MAGLVTFYATSSNPNNNPSFHKHSLSAYFVPGRILGAWDTAVSQTTASSPKPHSWAALVGKGQE